MRPRDRWLSLAAGLLAVAAALAVTAAVARWFHLATWRFDPVSVATWRRVAGGLADGTMAIRTWWAWSWAASFPLLAVAASVVGIVAWRRRHHLADALQVLADSGLARRRGRGTSTGGMTGEASPPSPAAPPTSPAVLPEIGLGAKGRTAAAAASGSPLAAPVQAAEAMQAAEAAGVMAEATSPAAVLQRACIDVSGVVGEITEADINALLAAQGVDLDAVQAAVDGRVDATPARDEAPRTPASAAEISAGVIDEGMGGAGEPGGSSADDWDADWDDGPEPAPADDTGLPPGWDTGGDEAYDYEWSPEGEPPPTPDDEADAGTRSSEDEALASQAAGGSPSAPSLSWVTVASSVDTVLPERRTLLLAYSRYARDGWTAVCQPALAGLADACDLVLLDGKRVVLVVLYDRAVHVTVEGDGVTPEALWADRLAPTVRALAARESLERALGGAVEASGLAMATVVVVSPSTVLRASERERAAWREAGVEVLIDGRDVEAAEGDAPETLTALLAACSTVARPLP